MQRYIQLLVTHTHKTSTQFGVTTGKREKNRERINLKNTALRTIVEVAQVTV